MSVHNVLFFFQKCQRTLYRRNIFCNWLFHGYHWENFKHRFTLCNCFLILQSHWIMRWVLDFPTEDTRSDAFRIHVGLVLDEATFYLVFCLKDLAFCCVGSGLPPIIPSWDPVAGVAAVCLTCIEWEVLLSLSVQSLSCFHLLDKKGLDEQIKPAMSVTLLLADSVHFLQILWKKTV